MTSTSIIPWFAPLQQMIPQSLRALIRSASSEPRPSLHHLAQNEAQLPCFVRQSPVAMRYVRLLAPLAWHQFPERDLQRNWGKLAVPYVPFVAACLVKLDQHITHMSQLREYLVDHPALVWALGFPLVPSKAFHWGFDVAASLPTQRHFTYMLRHVPQTNLQFLLDDTVRLIQTELETEVDSFGQAISLDTKHILAWVRENNPKDYVSNRYDKTQQPAGDPDCRLGCKRHRNQRASAKEPPPTPLDNPVPANTIDVGEFYWGYASGVVATKVPGWGEFVLAELTQPFDQSDVSYFFPLMTDVERRLGFRPKFGAFDASYDAWYVYAHFHRDGQHDWQTAFAAVPFSQRGGHKLSFDESGLPLCKAGLPMPPKTTFWSKTSLVHHECQRHACPLLFPQKTGRTCPINHKQWPKGGCTTTIAASIGSRIRYQIDRSSQVYKDIYKQRTATERVNSQAVELGIERPKIRNGQAIANQNALIYVLINLRGLHRVRQQKANRRSGAQ
jgi:hypothetical protein